DNASLRRRRFVEQLIKRGITGDVVDHVLRATEGKEAVQVDVGERPAEGVKRTETVLLGAYQSFFFSRSGEEQDGAPRRPPHLLESPSDRQKSGGSSGVVECAVINLIAC